MEQPEWKHRVPHDLTAEDLIPHKLPDGKNIFYFDLSKAFNRSILQRAFKEIIVDNFPLADDLEGTGVQEFEDEIFQRNDGPTLPVRHGGFLIFLDPAGREKHQFLDMPIIIGAVYLHYVRSGFIMCPYVAITTPYRNVVSTGILYSSLIVPKFHSSCEESLAWYESQGFRRHPLIPKGFFAVVPDTLACNVEDGVFPTKIRHNKLHRTGLDCLAFDFLSPPTEKDEEPSCDYILTGFTGPGHRLPVDQEGKPHIPSKFLQLFLEDLSVFHSAGELAIPELYSLHWFQHMMRDILSRERIYFDPYPWTRVSAYRKLIEKKQKAEQSQEEKKLVDVSAGERARSKL